MEIFIFIATVSGSASFPLCCADEFTKNETACCPQIEYMYIPQLKSVDSNCFALLELLSTAQRTEAQLFATKYVSVKQSIFIKSCNLQSAICNLHTCCFSTHHPVWLHGQVGCVDPAWHTPSSCPCTSCLLY